MKESAGMHTPPVADHPPVRHRRNDPVFIVGHGRSGTSVLKDLVHKHLKIAIGTETQFFIRYYRQLARYGDLARDVNRRLLVNDLRRERFFERARRFDFELDVERVVREAAPQSYAGVLSAILSQFAKNRGMERWGDKTPEYTRHLPVLRELFPSAQFIHVVRDGRDVALSTYQVHFGSKNAYAAAVEWRDVLQGVRRFAAGESETSFIEIRYEDLLQQPEVVFTRLVRFLDIEDPDTQVSQTAGRLARAELRHQNFNKWKTQLAPREQAVFASIAGSLLEAYGYDVDGPVPPMPGPLGRVYWELDNVVRRMSMRAYWRDNFYKARLRLQQQGLIVRRWRRRFEEGK